MTEYRFTLQKYKRGSKLTCPKCGRKQCFVKYVDAEGQIAFPDYVAGATMNIRANTIISHRIISKIIPLYWKKGSHGSHKQKIVQPKPTDYIDRDIMHRSLANYERNPLFHLSFKCIW